MKQAVALRQRLGREPKPVGSHTHGSGDTIHFGTYLPKYERQD